MKLRLNQSRVALSILACLLILNLSSRAAEPDSRLIFPLQEKHVHSSSIVECPNGDLLAAWFHGSGERSANDVKIQGARLKKGAAAWSPVFEMADTPDFPDCNPVVFIDARGRLWLFWIVPLANRWEHAVLKYRRAENYTKDGPPEWSWQDVILLKPGEEFQAALRDGFKSLNYSEPMWSEFAPRYTKQLVDAAGDPAKRETGWMTRARAIALPSGRILLPLYSDGFNVGLMAISDDEGAKWRASKPIVGLGDVQPTLAVRKNGDIVALLRDNGAAPSRVMKSVSKDQGESWSVARDTDLPNPGSSLAVVGLADGRWALVYNDTESGRNRLAVSLSKDEGETWPFKRYLEQSEPGDLSYAYPTAIQTRDGRIHVSYSYAMKGRAAIKHASFNPEWILESNEKK